MANSSHRVVIVGGGAGGTELAVLLAKAGQPGVHLVDRDTTHVWKPRLHELAAGTRRGQVDELDYAGLAEHWGFGFEQGELCAVDPSAQTLTLSPVRDEQGKVLVPQREIDYQVAVLAIGGVTPDLDVQGVHEHALMLDSAADAEMLFQRFSLGLLAQSSPGAAEPFHVVIVGSGATGIELAAYLATDRQCATLAPRSALPDCRIQLLEAADTLCPGMDDQVREAVVHRLDEAGVAMRTGQQVSKVERDSIKTAGGERLPADLTIWAAGRIGSTLADASPALDANDKRQWLVRPTLQTTVADSLFALGDCACIEGNPAPPTAQAASEQAEHLAGELPRYLDGLSPAAFRFEDKGTLLSLGEAGSVGEIKAPLIDDIQVRGRLSLAAYKGLQRQHQFRLLGAGKGTAVVLSDVFGRAIGPRMKVH